MMQSKDNDTVQSLLREIRDEIKALRLYLEKRDEEISDSVSKGLEQAKKVLPPPFKR